MLTATFYRRGAGARAVAENKAAAGDARRAAEALRGVLALGQRASEPSKAETAAVLDEATDRLRALQMRVARHAQLVARVKQQEAEVAAARASARVDEVDKGIVETNVRRVNILAESDEVRRDVVLARRRLKEDEELMASGGGFAGDDGSEDDCHRPTACRRVVALASSDWGGSVGHEAREGL